jgi:outer membrane scaffolding protein for murein synthesis (MipA/OmpV family)
MGLVATWANAQELPLWELGAGVGGLRLPHYRGADQSRSWLLPLPWFVYRGEILQADRDGARALLGRGDRWDVDVSLSAAPPSASNDNNARSGMADLPAIVEIGPNLNAQLARGPGWKMELRLPLRAGFTAQRHPRSIGWVAQPSINVDRALHGWNLGVQTGPVFGSRRYHAYFYDVAAADITAQRPAYSARGGYGGWQGTMALSRRMGRQWLGIFIRADSVAGATFEPSPLVRRRTNVALGFAWSWIWTQSNQRVPDPDFQR